VIFLRKFRGQGVVFLRLFTRRQQRLLREAEAEARDERSDRMLEDLQKRKRVVEGTLRERQRQNHWQQAIAQMIRGSQ